MLVRGFHNEFCSKGEFFPAGGGERPLQTSCVSMEKTRGGRGFISVMTLERMQALVARVLYHKNTGLP